MKRRISSLGFLLLSLLLLTHPALAAAPSQSDTATLSGVVLDQHNASIKGATVTVVNAGTGARRQAVTNDQGYFVIPALQASNYDLSVEQPGFATAAIKGVVLNVGDQKTIQIQLKAGNVNETVQVTSQSSSVFDESPAVGTVVDRQFVENLPLNGRSFQDLIMLTPGVVLTSPSYTNQGQFSVNGQRPDANYFTVDGVSANTGTATAFGLSQTASGNLPAFSALGGTNSLVSVDAMQEFRVQTSSFAPEFGRTPGAQVSIVTRSGTNGYHGTVFEYLRNDVLDANDWFSNENGLTKPKERQNDFGGVFGGPIIKDKTFFFFSYEGLRLSQPQTLTTIVPSLASRQIAPASIKPYVDAFPLPNGPELGGGFAQFAASFSSPSTLNAYSLRLDQLIGRKLVLFGRYNYSPSETTQRGSLSLGGVLSELAATRLTNQSLTIGLTATLTPNVSDELRANYTNEKAVNSVRLDQFGGAVPIPDNLLFPPGVSSANGFFNFELIGAGTAGTGAGLLANGKTAINEQRQFNVVDNLSAIKGAHQLKFGADYRWLSPISSPAAYEQVAVFLGMQGPFGVLGGTALVAALASFQETALLSQNFSVYAQDTWKVAPRITLTYGLRWDINPALKGKGSANALVPLRDVGSPATIALGTRGAPLYNTRWGNFAPRLGVAYQLRKKPGQETMLRGGFGIFYDFASGLLGEAGVSFPFSAMKLLSAVPFPLSPAQATAPPISANPPVTGSIFGADPNLRTPRTYQWNATVEQSLGSAQSLSISYIGAAGRDLLRADQLFSPNSTFLSGVWLTRNTGASDYNALQVKFQRRFSRGLQALVSYTWSHSLDNASSNGINYTPISISNPGIDRGNSDFDVRHSVSAALSYNVPSPFKSGIGHEILKDWSIESILAARSALPVDIVDTTAFFGGTQYLVRPNVVSGVPLYLNGSQYPGGKAFNPAAFTTPAPGQQGNLGRNVLRGFGAWQDDFSLRRQFHLTERVGLQFRTEFFNIFNHPNFGSPNNQIQGALFGVSTLTLASSLGGGSVGGGFNPLYSFGGPRSIQFALKLQF
jgi:hypothetical protein